MPCRRGGRQVDLLSLRKKKCDKSTAPEEAFWKQSAFIIEKDGLDRLLELGFWLAVGST